MLALKNAILWLHNRKMELLAISELNLNKTVKI